MHWENEPPFAEEISLPNPEEEIGGFVFREEFQKVSGPRASGKTRCLIDLAKNQSPSDKVLVLSWWPWEKQRWRKECKDKKNILCVTPDGLSRLLINRWWSTKNPKGSELLWTNEQPARDLYNEEEYSSRLLSQNRITPGVAHWLLKRNFNEILDSGEAKGNLLKSPPRLLVLDDVDEWEPEPLVWCRRLNPKLRVESFKKGTIDSKTLRLHGSYNPQWSIEHRKSHRYAKFEISQKGLGGWVLDILENSKPEHLPIVIIIQEKLEEWRDYFQERSGIPLEVLRASQTEGRHWSTVIIPKFGPHWGPPRNARNWLDLVCSRATHRCIAKMPSELPIWLPPLPETIFKKNGNPQDQNSNKMMEKSLWLGWKVD